MTYREELKTVKKSEGTGSGASDIYVHRWKHFEECYFLDVLVSNHTTFSIVPSCESPSTPSSSSTGDLDEADHETSPHTATISQQPREKKKCAVDGH